MLARVVTKKPRNKVEIMPPKYSQDPRLAKIDEMLNDTNMRHVLKKAVGIIAGLISITCSSKGPIPKPKIILK
jgi:hypothetical protein